MYYGFGRFDEGMYYMPSFRWSDELTARVDAVAGEGRRSEFVAEAVELALGLDLVGVDRVRGGRSRAEFVRQAVEQKVQRAAFASASQMAGGGMAVLAVDAAPRAPRARTGPIPGVVYEKPPHSEGCFCGVHKPVKS